MPPDEPTINACRYCGTMPAEQSNPLRGSHTIYCVNPECEKKPVERSGSMGGSHVATAREYNIRAWNHKYGTITTEMLAKLMREWERDPIWDIETTEGYEQYRDELLDYRRAKEQQWETEYQARQVAHATEMGLTVDSPLFTYICKLERQVEGLQRDVSRLTDRE